MSYQSFIQSKLLSVQPSGFKPFNLNECLFDFQRDTVDRACQLGKSAIFANTGSGKTLMQSAWADQVVNQTSGKVLILAPLAVATQTVEEASKFGININLCEAQSDVVGGINITNYEKIHKFDPSEFDGIVLDESSVIKHHSSQAFDQLTEFARFIPYRLACTATPAPNDFMEFGTHAEFLGVMKRTEMLSTFFKHDGGETSKWRLIKWGESEFWKWLCGWSVVMRDPSDLGYNHKGFDLPPLNTINHVVSGALQPKDGELVAIVRNMNDRRRARKASLVDRCEVAADLANNSDEAYLIWCDYNEEGDLLESLIPDAIQVSGKDSAQSKVAKMMDFTHGNARVLVSKPSICGFGMNWQHCRNVIFAGINDSWESMYQATNRCWRFGQTQEVYRHLIYSADEQVVIENLARKEKQAETMWREMAKHASQYSQIKGAVTRQEMEYNPRVEMELPQWLVA